MPGPLDAVLERLVTLRAVLSVRSIMVGFDTELGDVGGRLLENELEHVSGSLQRVLDRGREDLQRS